MSGIEGVFVTSLSTEELVTIYFLLCNLVGLTGCGLSIMVVDVVIGFILLVLIQDMLAGHSRDDRQVSWRGLGDGRITPIQ